MGEPAVVEIDFDTDEAKRKLKELEDRVKGAGKGAGAIAGGAVGLAGGGAAPVAGAAAFSLGPLAGILASSGAGQFTLQRIETLLEAMVSALLPNLSAELKKLEGAQLAVQQVSGTFRPLAEAGVPVNQQTLQQALQGAVSRYRRGADLEAQVRAQQLGLEADQYSRFFGGAALEAAEKDFSGLIERMAPVFGGW